MRLAGLKGGPHRLRHTFVSYALANKRSLREVGEIIGHSDEDRRGGDAVTWPVIAEAIRRRGGLPERVWAALKLLRAVRRGQRQAGRS